MPFPISSRQIYKNSPLEKVICQLTFPQILRIEKDTPYEFQEFIRKDFPHLIENNDVNIPLPSIVDSDNPNSEMVNIIQKQPFSLSKSFKFQNNDKSDEFGMSRSSVSLTTRKYKNWDKFITTLSNPLKKFVKEYQPIYFERIGLRYINVIQRSKIELDDVPWNQLLNSNLIGILNSDDFKDNVSEYGSNFILILNGIDGKVKISTSFVKPINSNEFCIQLDADFSVTTQIDCQNALEVLSQLNEKSKNMIQWALSDKLRNAFGPTT